LLGLFDGFEEGTELGLPLGTIVGLSLGVDDGSGLRVGDFDPKKGIIVGGSDGAPVGA